MTNLKSKSKSKSISAAMVFAITALSATAAFADAASAGKYTLDAGHAGVSFSVSHMGYSNVQGRFNDLAGDFEIKPAGKSVVNFTIKSASVDTAHDKRDKHLRSPDFFNSKLYPEINYTSHDVEFNAQGEITKINGSLKLLGKTRPVSIDVVALKAAQDPWGNYRVGYQASTKIKRSEFGMNFMQGGIGDDIALNISFEAIKQ